MQPRWGELQSSQSTKERGPRSTAPSRELNPKSSPMRAQEAAPAPARLALPGRASQEEQQQQQGFSPAAPAVTLNKAQILTHSLFTTCCEINLKHLRSHWHWQPVAICTRLQKSSRQALAAEFSLVLSHPCGGSRSPQTPEHKLTGLGTAPGRLGQVQPLSQTQAGRKPCFTPLLMPQGQKSSCRQLLTSLNPSDPH